MKRKRKAEEKSNEPDSKRPKKNFEEPSLVTSLDNSKESIEIEVKKEPIKKVRNSKKKEVPPPTELKRQTCEDSLEFEEIKSVKEVAKQKAEPKKRQRKTTQSTV